MFGNGAANAGQTIDEAGAFACVTDKWDEKEREKGHKLVDMAARCVTIPDDPAAPKYTTDCVGKYEYMPDESWKGSGTCTWNLKGADKVYEAWEEGSRLKESLYKVTGGTGRYEAASGGGTYSLESLRTPSRAAGLRDKWCCPKVAPLPTPSETSAKLVNTSEDAHTKSMSTFATDKHLRALTPFPRGRELSTSTLVP